MVMLGEEMRPALKKTEKFTDGGTDMLIAIPLRLFSRGVKTQIWNELPYEIKTCEFFNAFKKAYKKFLIETTIERL